MLLMVASSALSIFMNAKINKINYNKYMENIKYEKKSNYIRRIFNRPVRELKAQPMVEKAGNELDS